MTSPAPTPGEPAARARADYWLNDKSEFYWEIVGPDGMVAEFIEKTSDDDNRDDAERRVVELNEGGTEAAATPEESHEH